MTDEPPGDPGEDRPARDPAEVFAEALELPDGERGAYLDRLCRGDTALRAHVESSLAALPYAENVFQTRTLQEQRRTAALRITGHPDEPGDILDRYRFGDFIGAGGFGEVWRAETAEGLDARRRPHAHVAPADGTGRSQPGIGQPR